MNGNIKKEIDCIQYMSLKSYCEISSFQNSCLFLTGTIIQLNIFICILGVPRSMLLQILA